MASDSVQAKRADLLNKAFADAFVMDGNYNIVVKQ